MVRSTGNYRVRQGLLGYFLAVAQGPLFFWQKPASWSKRIFFLARPRRKKLHILRFAASGKAHPLRSSSSLHKIYRFCGGLINALQKKEDAKENPSEGFSLDSFPNRGAATPQTPSGFYICRAAKVESAQKYLSTLVLSLTQYWFELYSHNLAAEQQFFGLIPAKSKFPLEISLRWGCGFKAQD